jgi:hypothetical protein
MDLTKTLSRNCVQRGRECKTLGMNTSVKLSWHETRYTSANMKIVNNANLLPKSDYKTNKRERELNLVVLKYILEQRSCTVLTIMH